MLLEIVHLLVCVAFWPIFGRSTSPLSNFWSCAFLDFSIVVLSFSCLEEDILPSMATLAAEARKSAAGSLGTTWEQLIYFATFFFIRPWPLICNGLFCAVLLVSALRWWQSLRETRKLDPAITFWNSSMAIVHGAVTSSAPATASQVPGAEQIESAQLQSTSPPSQEPAHIAPIEPHVQLVADFRLQKLHVTPQEYAQPCAASRKTELASLFEYEGPGEDAAKVTASVYAQNPSTRRSTLNQRKRSEETTTLTFAAPSANSTSADFKARRAEGQALHMQQRLKKRELRRVELQISAEVAANLRKLARFAEAEDENEKHASVAVDCGTWQSKKKFEPTGEQAITVTELAME